MSSGSHSKYEELAAMAKQEVDLYAALSDYLEIVEAYADDKTAVGAVRIDWENKLESWLIPYELRNVAETGHSSCLAFNKYGKCSNENCLRAHHCLICAEKEHTVAECDYVAALLGDLSGLIGRNVSRIEAVDVLENIVDAFRGLSPEDTLRLSGTNGPETLFDMPSQKKISTSEQSSNFVVNPVDMTNQYEIAADQIVMCDFKKTPDISSTSYADVFKGELFNKLHNERKMVAIKRYKLFIKDDKLKREQLREESKMLEKSSEYAVRCFGHWFKEDLQFIVMELLPGNLEDYIRQNCSAPFAVYSKFVKSATKQLLVAYKFLHASGIFHRDVKPQNILYSIGKDDTLPRLKLCDFAFSRWKQEMSYATSTTYIISSNENIRWAPPEMKFSGQSNQHEPEKVDVWSLGHVLFYIANQGRGGIFEMEANFDDHDCYVTNILESAVKQNYPLLADAIRQMMFKDPSKRKSLNELADHPFVWYGKDFRKKLERLYRLKDKNDTLKDAFVKFIDDNAKSSKPGVLWCTQLPSYIAEIIQNDKIFLPDRKSAALSKLLFFCRNFMVHYLKALVDHERSRLSTLDSATLSSEKLEQAAEDTFYEQIVKTFPNLLICFADFVKHELNTFADTKMRRVLESAPVNNLSDYFTKQTEDQLADLFMASVIDKQEETTCLLLDFRPSVLLNDKARAAFRVAADHNLINCSCKILSVAASLGRLAMQIIAYSAQRSCDEGRSVVQQAIREGKLDLVRKLVETDSAVISWTDNYNCNLAHTAAEFGDFALLELILKKDPNAVAELDINRNLPLHVACRNRKNPDTIELLLKSANAGRAYNQGNRAGETPLICACKEGNIEGASRLIAFYVGISGTDNFAPPLHQAFISACDTDGNTPLHWACKSDNFQLIELLVKYKADCKISNNDGLTALATTFENLVERN